MDDKFIQALIVSEQLRESRLDEAGFGSTVMQMAKNAGKAMLNKVPGAQTVKKVANGVQNAYKTAANQVDDKKNTKTIKQCVDLLAKQLCKQMLAANSDEKAMKNLMPVLTKNYGIPQDVVKAAYKEVQQTNAQAAKDTPKEAPNDGSANTNNAKNESARANRVSRMLHITEEENNGNQEANTGNQEANQALSLLGNVYKNKFDLTALSKVWESLKTNSATKQLFADQKFKQLSDAVDAMIAANNQGQQQAQEGGEADPEDAGNGNDGTGDAAPEGADAGGDTGDASAEGADAANSTGEQTAENGGKLSFQQTFDKYSDIAKQQNKPINTKAGFTILLNGLAAEAARQSKKGTGQTKKLIQQLMDANISSVLESRKMNYAYILNESADPFAEFDKMTGFTGASEEDLQDPYREGYAHCQQAMHNGKCGPQPKKVPYPRNSKEADEYVSGWESAWMDGDDFIRR